MTIGAVSTLASREALRIAMTRTQMHLEAASGEVASGRHYDVGLALGSSAARSLNMRQLAGELNSIGATNNIFANRLSQTESALSALVDIANGLFKSAINARQLGGDRNLLIADAKARLGSLMDVLATSSNGAYIFGGTNASVPPLEDYLVEPPSAARLAVSSAFQVEFGISPDDPQVNSILPAQIDAYLGGSFAALFDDPQWQSIFSAASTDPVRMRISTSEVVEVPASANDAGIRALVSGLIAAIDSGAADLAAETYTIFADRIATIAANAAAKIVENATLVGATQERLAKASERIEVQKRLLEKEFNGAESIDVLEATTRFNLLATKLETSYAVTARLQQLNLLSFI